MKTTKTRLTYNIVAYETPDGRRYVATAWDDNGKVLLATADHERYGEARAELDGMARVHGAVCHWLDGFYRFSPNLGMVPASLVHD